MLAALIGVIVLTAVFLYVVDVRHAEDPPPENRPSPQPETLPGGVRPGDSVIVGDLDNDDPSLPVCLIYDVQDIEAVKTLVRNRDESGMLHLIRHRRAIFVDNRTPATFLERGPVLCRVRILAGDQRGKEAWISPDFLLRELPQ